MPQHAHYRILSQYSFQAQSRLTGSIRHYHHAGVLGIADAHAPPLWMLTQDSRPLY